MPAAISASALRAVAALGDRRAKPDLRWVASLLDRAPGDLAPIVDELAEMAGTAEVVREAHRQGGRSFYAQFRAPFDLYLMIRAMRPEHVVETGVSSGVSSTFALLALRRNGEGELHSIDMPIQQARPRLARDEPPVCVPPGASSGWAVPEAVRSGWDLRLGPSQELLPRLVRSLPRVDLFLHDSFHSPKHLTFELETVRRRLRPGSLVLADNTQWTGDAFDRFAASLGAPIRRRGRSDLLGIRVPEAPAKPRTRRRP